jgi:putative DNA-invertase from lambdoid prophage Rac
VRVVLYVRVRTDDKDQDPERQFLKCRQYCELHGHEIVGTYQDHETGDSDPFKREHGAHLLENDPEGIVIFSMDRLTRQHPVKVIQLIDYLKGRSIKVISITEPVFNMENEMGEVMLYLMGWFNNYFLRKLTRDIKSGMDKVRAQGKVIGRPEAGFNRYRAYQLLLVEGQSLRVVSKELGASPATLLRFKREAQADPSAFIKEPVRFETG